MAFTNSKYETDDGTVVSIRLSDLKLALAGTPPADPVEQSGWFIAVAGSKRSRNKRIARSWIYSRFETTENGLKAIETVRFPKLTLAAYQAAAPVTQVYDGKTYTFVDKSGEG